MKPLPGNIHKILKVAWKFLSQLVKDHFCVKEELNKSFLRSSIWLSTLAVLSARKSSLAKLILMNL